MKATTISLIIKKLAYEAMEWVKKSDHDLIMLFFYFKKTYDKVNLTFLQEFMKVLGFSK
jgi:hypothetical protein